MFVCSVGYGLSDVLQHPGRKTIASACFQFMRLANGPTR